MMDRREELKKELEGLNNEELFIIKSCSVKREKIYAELRELDRREQRKAKDYHSPDWIRRSETNKKNLVMYNVVHRLLKENPQGLKSGEIKKFLQDNYDFNPSNMTQFMNNLRLRYPDITKPFKAFYKFEG